jgi:nitrate/nitrite transporter NarK
VVSRGARFYLVAGLLWYFGPPIKAFIEKHLGWLMVLFFVLLFGGFVAIKYVL